MDDILRVECPACGKILKAPSTFAGKKVTCKKCRNKFVLETKQERSPEAPPPRPASAQEDAVINTDKSEDEEIVWSPQADQSSDSTAGGNPFEAPSSESHEQIVSMPHPSSASTTAAVGAGQGVIITGFKMSFMEMFWLVGKFMAAAWIWSILVWMVLGTVIGLFWLVVGAALFGAGGGGGNGVMEGPFIEQGGEMIEMEGFPEP